MVEQLKALLDAGNKTAGADQSRRLADFQAFETVGVPTRKQEEYKFTDLSRLFAKFDIAVPSATNATPSQVGIEGMTSNTLVFVNGKFRSELSHVLDDELEVFTIDEAPEALRAHYGQYAKSELDPMLALNSALATDGIAIHLPANKKLSAPVLIHHHTDGNAASLTFSRILVVAREGSEASFIEQYSSESGAYLLNATAELFVARNAHLHWYKIQNDKSEANLVDNYFARQESDSTSTLTTISLEGNVIRNNVRIDVDGSNSEANLYGLYLVEGSSHVDNHTAVDHRQPHSESNELYKGILDDKARGVFNGKVFVRQEAQKTNAFQSNKNILISDNATVNTKPQLEIWADDVKCSHGCTTGQLDAEALFYLRTRGLSKESARSLLLHAFALEAIDHAKDTEIGPYLETLVAQKLKFHKK